MTEDDLLIDMGDLSCPYQSKIKRSITELETDYGYEFTLVDDVIHYHCRAEHPDFAEIKPRLDTIRAHRDQAITYFCCRSDPVRSDILFWIAAEKAAASARQQESLGHPDLAHREWGRFARLFTLFACSSGANDPTIPWDEWIASFTGLLLPSPKVGRGAGGEGKWLEHPSGLAALAGVAPKHSLPWD